MVLGFTVSSLNNLTSAVDIATEFLHQNNNCQFLIILFSESEIPQYISDALPSGASIKRWNELDSNSRFFKHWPFIYPAQHVLSLLITQTMAQLLRDYEHVYYLRTDVTKTDVKEIMRQDSTSLYVVGSVGLMSSCALDMSLRVSAIYAHQRVAKNIGSWSDLLESYSKVSSIAFVDSFEQFIHTLNCDADTIENSMYTSLHPKEVSEEWNVASNGLPIRDSLREIALNEAINGVLDIPSPFSSDCSKQYVQWGRSVSLFGVTDLPRFLEAAFKENEELLTEHVLNDFSSARDSRKWWRSKKELLRPEISLFKIRDLFAKRQQLKVKDLGPNISGVDVFGYLSAGVGVGQSARLNVEALHTTEIDVTAVSLPRPRSNRLYLEHKDIALTHDIALMCVDAYQFLHQRHIIGERYFSQRYTIAQWFWELEQVPSYYIEPLSVIQEFWAPTLFLKNAMTSIAPSSARIEYMPLPVRPGVTSSAISKSLLGLEDRFLFYFSFDFLSVMKRKNPVGLLRAYIDAFKPADGAALLIKSINGFQRPTELGELRLAAAGRSDIKIVDEFVTPQMNSALMATADCYVSLHRSEGYGLTLAEAMALGKPVIATGYSGNMDFMSESNSVPISYSLVPVGDNAEGYPSTSQWAEPDHEASVLALQKMMSDRNFAVELGKAAQLHLERNFSIEVVGNLMLRRIQEIRAQFC